MGCAKVPRAVFTETNLGTRLAVPASPDITADDFKKEVERMHLNCFPEIGNIRVNALMVKQKLHCYHLSGSLPLKCAFRGSNVTWFLQTHVVLSNVPPHVESSKYNEAEVGNVNSAANVINGSVELGGVMSPSSKKKPKCKRKKVKVQRFTYLRASMRKIYIASCFLRKRKKMNVKKKPKMGDPRRDPIQRSVNETEMLCQSASGADVNWSEESDTNVIAEATGETITEPTSVSGIINKYFSEYDEVASTTMGYQHGKQVNRSAEREYLKMQSNIMSPVRACQHVWGEKPSSEASREKQKELQVGNRLLRASSNLRLTPSNRRSILSLYQHIDGESPFSTSTSMENHRSIKSNLQFGI